MNIMQKKGLSHIEAILAFVLFISSIIAILYFFNFPKDTTQVNSNLDNIYSQIKGNVSTNLLTYGVLLNDPTVNNLTLNLNRNISGYGVYVEDYQGNAVNATIEDNNSGLICLESYNGIDPMNKFVYVYLNPYIEQIPAIGNCTSDERLYNITSNKIENLISLDNVNVLKNEYDQNYSVIKSYFGIPAGQDFGFELDMNNYSILARNNIPKGIEIYAKDYKLNLINESMNSMKIANLKVITW